MTRAGQPARTAQAGEPARTTRAGEPAPTARATSGDVERAIEALVAARPPLLIVVDFDGTLAVGTRDPAAARIEPLAQRALRRLGRIATERPGRVHVAVLTGRIVADVVTRVRAGGVEYLGDHGLQQGMLPRGGRAERLRVTTDESLDAHREPAEILAVGVAAELGAPRWLFVERKGPSVAFHVRQADDVAAARASVVAAIAAVERRLGLVHGLAHYRGRSVVDLRPREAGGKREAVERLVARHRPGAIVALGDEVSDIDAFEAVIAARAADPTVRGFTVAVHGGLRPAPPDLVERADLALDGAPEVGRLLAALARRL